MDKTDPWGNGSTSSTAIAQPIAPKASTPPAASPLEAQLRAAAPERFLPETQARDGQRVLDVIVAPAEVDDDGWLIGTHTHNRQHGPFPGGVSHVAIPANAPSRAWAKIEEAIAWAGLPVRAGDVALEIGAAPGGAVMALAKRGDEVWGVDTGELAPNVRAMAGVHHLAIKVGALRWEQLP